MNNILKLAVNDGVSSLREMRAIALEELEFNVKHIYRVYCDNVDVDVEFWKACGVAEAFQNIGVITIDERYTWVRRFANAAEGLENEI